MNYTTGLICCHFQTQTRHVYSKKFGGAAIARVRIRNRVVRIRITERTFGIVRTTKREQPTATCQCPLFQSNSSVSGAPVLLPGLSEAFRRCKCIKGF